MIYRPHIFTADRAKQFGLHGNGLFTAGPERSDDKPKKKPHLDPGRGHLILTEAKFHELSRNIISAPCTSYSPKNVAKKDRIPLLHRCPNEGFGVHYAELNTFPIDHKAIVDYCWKDPDTRLERDTLSSVSVRTEIYPKVKEAFQTADTACRYRDFHPFPQGAVVYVSFGSEQGSRVPCIVLSSAQVQTEFASFHRITVVQTVPYSGGDKQYPKFLFVLKAGQYGLREAGTAIYYLIRTVDCTVHRNIVPVDTRITAWYADRPDPRLGLVGDTLQEFLSRVADFVWA